MSGAHSARDRRVCAGLLAGRWLVSAILVAMLSVALPAGGHAADYALQTTTPTTPGLAPPAVDPDQRMLVEADELIYDYDNNRVAAVGNVIIYYGGYTLEAQEVSYDQNTGRLIAIGAVRMVDPTGQTYRSEYLDITDDFADGFVRSLRVDTAQRTHFHATAAERSLDKTVFYEGDYSACPSCVDNPDKPPFWKIKAKKIILDHEENVVRFEDATFEFFGTPVAWVPYFTVADPLAKRKSGFLTPSIDVAAKLGVGVTVPYFMALAPHYDLTVSPAYFSRQGLLANAEWRHRLARGHYTIKAAGIYQRDKAAFDPASAGFRDWRGAIRTTGRFNIAPDWTLGWDGTLSTDKTFTRDYAVVSPDSAVTTSTVHVTGLRDRNYFQARASHYRILTDPIPAVASYRQGRQAVVVPVVDSLKVFDESVLGGEVTYRSNVSSLLRSEDDPIALLPAFYHGTAGTTVRASKEIAWQDRIIGPNGEVLRPFAYLRGDAFALNSTSAAPQLTTDNYAFRAMPAVGFDASLPLHVVGPASSHVIEPRAQLIVRPNEMRAGVLPNNDAQSLVFDDTTLFKHDKFSGWDRTEGGTRLNLGVHYNGRFAGGAAISGTFGQSYHLLGTNPYATSDIANVGPGSGLDTNVSDFVGGATIDTGLGPRFSIRGRFGAGDFSLKRAEIGTTNALGPVTTSTSFVFLKGNPNTGVATDSSVVRASASINLYNNWRAFGTLTYDVSNAAIASDSFGIAYDDESATVSISYSETRPNYTDLTSNRWFNLRIALRTLGAFGYTGNVSRATD